MSLHASLANKDDYIFALLLGCLGDVRREERVSAGANVGDVAVVAIERAMHGARTYREISFVGVVGCVRSSITLSARSRAAAALLPRASRARSAPLRSAHRPPGIHRRRPSTARAVASPGRHARTRSRVPPQLWRCGCRRPRAKCCAML